MENPLSLALRFMYSVAAMGYSPLHGKR